MMKNGEYLLSAERVGRAVAKLALPSVLSTMISMIYNLTDTYFIGLLRDTAQLSAVSVAMPIMWLISAIANMISAGAPQLISMKMGAGDAAGAKRCSSFCVFGTIVMSALITPAALMVIHPLLRLMGADGEILTHAESYLNIIVIGTVISGAGGAIQGVLRAGGLTSRASVCSAAGIVANIILDPIFILSLDMGMSGAALATVLGSAVSLLMSLVFARGEISIRSAIPKIDDVSRIFKLSLASTISSCISALTVGMSFTMATSFGEATLPSISVASKVYSLVVSLVSTIAFSIQPFIGYNYTSGNASRLRKGVSTTLAFGTIICLTGAISFFTLGGQYMALFTNDPDVVASGIRMLRCLAVGTPILALQMTCSSYLSATGQVAKTMLSNLARQVIIFAPVMLAMKSIFGLTGLMLAYPITDIAATILAVLLCAGDISSLYKRRSAVA